MIIADDQRSVDAAMDLLSKLNMQNTMIRVDGAVDTAGERASVVLDASFESNNVINAVSYDTRGPVIAVLSTRSPLREASA